MTTYNDGGASNVINSYLYNKRRLPVSETLQVDTNTWTVGYAYTGNAHLATLTYPDSLSVAYAPNALGQPTQAGTYATGVTYFPNGAIQQFTYGNGIIHTLTQNARGLPDRSRDADGSTSVHDDSYDYDPNGNVLAISDGVAEFRGDRDMLYDDLNRLVEATSPMFGTASYSYDVLDNLTQVHVTGGSQPRNHAYCYDNNWRLTNVAAATCSGGSVIGLGYDVQGNLTNKNGVTYGFDYGNRMRSGGPETYRYDAHGRRVRSNSSAGMVHSFYSQSGQILFQRDERSSKRRQYIYLGGSLLAEHSRPLSGSTATITYQHTDALGTPVAITNSSRTVTERREYEPYGYQTTPALQDGPNYTGHVADAATGLVYMQQRYYDPMIPRFLSVDPVTADNDPVGQFHRYRYASNNPYTLTDPDGRLPRDGTTQREEPYEKEQRVEEARRAREEELRKQRLEERRARNGHVYDEPLYCSGGSDCDFMYNQRAFLEGRLTSDEFSARTQAQGVGGMIGAGGGLLIVSGPEGWAALERIYAFVKLGRERSLSKDFRLAPFGNRTGNQFGRWPHYHRRVRDGAGGTKPGQGIGRHRPWETKPTDKSFWDRF